MKFGQMCQVSAVKNPFVKVLKKCHNTGNLFRREISVSYSLYRVHWKITIDGKPVEKYSYHKSEDKVAEFIREVVSKNTANPNNRYSTLGSGNLVHHIDGRAYAKVIASQRPGFWHEELGLPGPGS
jgi:hypothetical protein